MVNTYITIGSHSFFQMSDKTFDEFVFTRLGKRCQCVRMNVYVCEMKSKNNRDKKKTF